MTVIAPDRLDITANRAARKWSRRAQAGRLLWALAQPLFSLSPRPCWAWRRALLRAFGARIGRGVHILPSVRITIPWNLEVGDEAAIGDRVIVYALGPIRIGRQATVSQHAHLCAGTHDFTRPDMPLVKLPIEIGEGAWICADAFIGPGVVVGARAVAGARAVVMKAVEPGMIVVGNPARPSRKRGGAA